MLRVRHVHPARDVGRQPVRDRFRRPVLDAGAEGVGGEALILQLARGDAVQPSFATHDGRLIDIIQTLAGRYHRDRLQMEFALYLGRSGGTQQRLVDAGEQVRVYVPFGPQWFGRLVGGLDDRPAGLGAAVRSLLPGA